MNDPDDDELLAWLADALHASPDEMRRNGELAAMAWIWRDPDASMADLIDDSVLAGSSMRDSGDMHRSLAFRLEPLALDLEIEAETGLRGTSFRAQLLPGPTEGIAVFLRMTEQTMLGGEPAVAPAPAVEVAVDGFGGFRFEAPARGLVRLEVRRGERSAVTPWITL